MDWILGEFPGISGKTGEGNGVSVRMKTWRDWVAGGRRRRERGGGGGEEPWVKTGSNGVLGGAGGVGEGVVLDDPLRDWHVFV